jgi:N-acetylneuraminic acid mutarotase
VVCDEPCNRGRSCPDEEECQTGWVNTSEPPGSISPREQAAYTSVGNQLFIWGGLNESGTALDSGALYDPRSDSWKVVEASGSPSPRSFATAVWTGTYVVVWGGFDPGTGTALDDGALYDPVDDEWQPMHSGLAARSAPIGAEIQNQVLFWGGTDGDGNQLEGLDSYNVGADSWERLDGAEAPGALEDSAWGAGTQTFWLFGGRTSTGATDSYGYYYGLTSSDWHQVSTSLEPRWGAFGAFVDLDFYVWGGRNLDDVFDDGGTYSVGSTFGSWDDISSMSAPSARYRAHRESGWSFDVDGSFVVIAGLEAPGQYLQDGAISGSTRFSSWDSIEPWPGSASHAFGAVGWVADELVIWGGRNGTSLTDEGLRYLAP